MNSIEKHILVIFGGSGDLTQRKLIPALFDLYRKNMLPKIFAIVGVGRTDLDHESYRELLEAGLQKFHGVSPEQTTDFLKLCYYIHNDFQSHTTIELFSQQLYEIDIKTQTKGNFIFYLSTPPSLYEPIVSNLGKAKLTGVSEKFPGWKRLIVEKPFGKDVASARKLQQHLISHFDEEQIYRIDHYLGKETAQNILVTRFYNTIFEPLWNRNYIHHVEITSAEQEGIGNRGGYYDSSGALRDMLQNHLLQLVALTAMEPPTNFNADSIRNEVLKVFQSLRPLNLENLKKQVVRGQYTQSHVGGNLKKAYTEELDIPANSRTESYVALKFFIDNWRWGGVPFFIRTGKNLPTRVTEIVITFKSIPHPVFVKTASTQESKNQLIIRIQPDEGIAFRFGVKIPGIGFDVETTNMNFKYAQKEGVELPSAYERLLHDCMQGDASLFTRGDAVDLAWQFVQPILDEWESNPDFPLFGYPAGSWGPKEASDLKIGYGEWRYPCKNLNSDGGYCEL